MGGLSLQRDIDQMRLLGRTQAGAVICQNLRLRCQIGVNEREWKQFGPVESGWALSAQVPQCARSGGLEPLVDDHLHRHGEMSIQEDNSVYDYQCQRFSGHSAPQGQLYSPCFFALPLLLLKHSNTPCNLLGCMDLCV